MNLTKFRNLMAENGFEFTPEQASEVYSGAKRIIRNAKKMSQVDIWNLKEQSFEGISDQEKDEIIELYKKVKEIWM